MRWDQTGWDSYGPSHMYDVTMGADANGKIVAADWTSYGQPSGGMDTTKELLGQQTWPSLPGAGNGAKTLGQAEMWLGAGRGAQHAVVTLWGTGVGAAVFADGRLFRGAASSAGEWGHTTAVVGGKNCRCGASGCLEAYIGAEALLHDWARADELLTLPDDLDQVEWIDRLLAAASSSDAAAMVLDRTATYVGTAAANLVNLFNPERVIIGGWVGLKLGPLLLPKVRAVLAAQALDYAAARVSVVLGQLGTDAVALGASTLVVEELLARGGQPPELLGHRGALVQGG